MDGLSQQKDMMENPNLQWHGGKVLFVTLITRDNIFDMTFCPHFSKHSFAEGCEAKVEEYREKEQSQ